MKKLILVCLVLAMLVSALSACGNDTVDPVTGTTADQGTTPSTEPEVTVALDEYGRPVVESSLPDDLDYNNEQINIMIRTSNKERFTGVEGKEATAIEQVIYARNEAVMDKLNVYLNFVPIEQSGSDTKNYDTTIQGYLAGTGEMDIVTSYAYYTPALAIVGCFTNLNNVNMIDMTSIVWNQTFQESVAYEGALYFNVGDFSYDYTRQIVATYFNKDLANNYFGSADLLYDMVKDNSWTMENAAAMLKDIHKDVNQDSIQDADDFYGFILGATSSPCEAMVTALGFNYTVKDNEGQYQLFQMDTGLTDKIDDLQAFIASEFCAPRSLWNWSGARDMFKKQSALFYVATLDMADQLADVDFDYGFLPLFKYNEAQENYCTGMGDSFSLQAIMSNCTDIERAGAVLQCLNEISYKSLTPEYFDILLKGRFADAPEDAEMLELLRSTVTLDFGRIYSGTLDRVTGNVWNNFVKIGGEYTKWYNEKSASTKELLVALQQVLKGTAQN